MQCLVKQAYKWKVYVRNKAHHLKGLSSLEVASIKFPKEVQHLLDTLF